MRFSPGISTPIIRAIRLTLPLLVPLVRADHTNHALALDDLAVLAKLLDRRSYFHIKPCFTTMRPFEKSNGVISNVTTRPAGKGAAAKSFFARCPSTLWPFGSCTR